MVPKAVACGNYHNRGIHTYYYLSDFHDMDLSTAPEAASFAGQIAKLHQDGTSPNGLFGFPVPTVIADLEHTVTYEKSWAKSFTNLLLDVIKYDNEANGSWAELDAASKQLIDVVIPRLLGALQSNGREIKPTLIHGDLWEENVGIDKETGNTIVFDPGSLYAHNEMEFGTWRCSWARYFKSPEYLHHYQRHIEPSEPAEEWDDRNRLYSIHPNLLGSAKHPETPYRAL